MYKSIKVYIYIVGPSGATNNSVSPHHEIITVSAWFLSLVFRGNLMYFIPEMYLAHRSEGKLKYAATEDLHSILRSKLDPRIEAQP